MKFTHFCCHPFLRPHFQESKSNYVSARKERMKKKTRIESEILDQADWYVQLTFFPSAVIVFTIQFPFDEPITTTKIAFGSRIQWIARRWNYRALVCFSVKCETRTLMKCHFTYADCSFFFVFGCYRSHSSMNVQPNASMKLPFSDDVMSWWTLTKRMRLIKRFDCVYLTTL